MNEFELHRHQRRVVADRWPVAGVEGRDLTDAILNHKQAASQAIIAHNSSRTNASKSNMP
jgi:hypothetical protein